MMACMVTYMTDQVCHPIARGFGYVIAVIDALMHIVREDGGLWVLSHSCVLTIMALSVSRRSLRCPRPSKDRPGLTGVNEKRSIDLIQ